MRGMIRLLKFATRHAGGSSLLVLGAALALAAFAYALNLDEGSKSHLSKQLAEAREMPLRLLT